MKEGVICIVLSNAWTAMTRAFVNGSLRLCEVTVFCITAKLLRRLIKFTGAVSHAAFVEFFVSGFRDGVVRVGGENLLMIRPIRTWPLPELYFFETYTKKCFVFVCFVDSGSWCLLLNS